MHLLREDSVDVVPDAIDGIENLGLVGERELAEPGHAGSDREDLPILLLEQADELRILRARADQAHLAAEDVPELRELVELRSGEESADAGEAWVDVTGECMPGGSVVHLPELEDSRVRPRHPTRVAR